MAFKHNASDTADGILTQAEYESTSGHVLDNQATGDIVYADSGTTMTRLAIGTADQVLVTDGSTPSYAKITTSNIADATLVIESEGISSNDNDTTIPTSAAVKDYVDTELTAQDLDFSGDSGSGAVDLDSQSFIVAGTANEIETSASSQTITIGLVSEPVVDGITAGNVQVGITGDNEIDTSSGNLTIDSAGGTVTIDDNLTITGDLTVSGTTTNVNTTTTTLEDPIITLGTQDGGDAVADDNKDRGIAFKYHDGSVAKTGFIGYDDSEGYFKVDNNASISSEVVTFSATSPGSMAIGQFYPVLFTSTGAMDIRGVKETSNYSATALTAGTYQVDTFGYNWWLISGATTGSPTFDFRWTSSTTLDSWLNVSESLTFTFILNMGATVYHPAAIKIDNVTQTVKWLGGTAPSGGTGSRYHSYTYTIVKTGTSTYVVLGSHTDWA